MRSNKVKTCELTQKIKINLCRARAFETVFCFPAARKRFDLFARAPLPRADGPAMTRRLRAAYLHAAVIQQQLPVGRKTHAKALV